MHFWLGTLIAKHVGIFGEQKNCKKAHVRFQIISGDKIILNQIKNKLEQLDFRPRLGLANKKGYQKTFGKCNLDMYRLNLYHQKGVLKLAKILLNLSKHAEKIWKMKFILENYGKNWEEIEPKINEFKKWVKNTNLNSFTQELPSLRHATRDEDEYSL
ncbi:MAG: hypothetical protein QXL86_03305 [Candidatus Aenigmatarchaeota archaeon]